MKTEFTPGPWKATEDYDGWRVYKAEGKSKIGRVYICERIEQGKDMGKADARLIASAPELLEALLSLKTANGGNDFEGWHPSFHSAIKKANAAIAKATGKEVSND